MTERGILFSGAMVRALLNGTKTQTRRALKRQPWASCLIEEGHDGESPFVYSALGGAGPGYDVEESRTPCRCPYGQPGDRLWVRETWGVVSNDWDADGNLVDWTPDRPATAITEMRFGQGYYSGHAIYAADGSYEWAGDDDGGGEPRSAWHPSIHMPRAASRILLEITGVRVERLQAISEADALAEGPAPHPAGAVCAFSSLWRSINGVESWVQNPWVWVVEFRRIES